MHDLCNCADISRCFFNTYDVLNIFHKCCNCLWLKSTSCTAWYIVQNRRNIYFITNSCVMSNQSVLCCFIIIWCNEQKSVSSIFLSFFGQLDRCSCTIRTCSGDDRDTVVHTLNCKTGCCCMFFLCHSSGFTCCSTDDDRICSACNLLL